MYVTYSQLYTFKVYCLSPHVHMSYKKKVAEKLAAHLREAPIHVAGTTVIKTLNAVVNSKEVFVVVALRKGYPINPPSSKMAKLYVNKCVKRFLREDWARVGESVYWKSPDDNWPNAAPTVLLEIWDGKTESKTVEILGQRGIR